MSDAEATIRCDCGCAVLVFDYWKWDDSDHEGWFDVYTAPPRRRRIRTALRILFGKDPWVDTLVFGPKQVAELQGFLALCNSQPKGFVVKDCTEGKASR